MLLKDVNEMPRMSCCKSIKSRIKIYSINPQCTQSDHKDYEKHVMKWLTASEEKEFGIQMIYPKINQIKLIMHLVMIMYILS